MNKNFLSIFVPAIALMNKLKHPAKIALLSGLVVAIIGSIIYFFLLLNLQSQAEFRIKEKLGVEYIEKVNEFLTNVQSHRYFIFQYQNGDANAKTSIKRDAEKVNTSIQELDKIDTKLNKKFMIENRWQDIKGSWKTDSLNMDLSR